MSDDTSIASLIDVQHVIGGIVLFLVASLLGVAVSLYQDMYGASGRLEQKTSEIQINECPDPCTEKIEDLSTQLDAIHSLLVEVLNSRESKSGKLEDSGDRIPADSGGLYYGDTLGSPRATVRGDWSHYRGTYRNIPELESER